MYCLLRELCLLKLGWKICRAVGYYLVDPCEDVTMGGCVPDIFQGLLNDIDRFGVCSFRDFQYSVHVIGEVRRIL